MANRWGKNGNSDKLCFLELQDHCSKIMVTAAMKQKVLASWKKSYDKSRQHIKKQRYYLANKSPYSLCYGFSSSHVSMWVLDQRDGLSAEELIFWNCGVGEDS